MEYNRIPVRMRCTVPRLIDRNDSTNWSLVQDGSISEVLALKIFDRYFDVIPPGKWVAIAQ